MARSRSPARRLGRPAARPLGRVVVATDLSEAARPALARVPHLPLAPACEVTIVHVAPARSGRSAKGLGAERRSRLEAEGAALSRALERGGHPDAAVRRVAGYGVPEVEITNLARESGADLVVVGRRGAGRVRDLLLGTTADRVAQLAVVPVLIVGSSPAAPYRRPLVAIDGERGSRAVVEGALRVLPPGCRRVQVVAAFSLFGEGWLWAGGTPTKEVRRLRARAHERARDGVARALVPAQGRGWVFGVALREGDPREVISSMATRTRSDLLALGTRARPGIGPFRLGRVAAYLLRSIACDLLVVPQDSGSA